MGHWDFNASKLESCTPDMVTRIYVRCDVCGAVTLIRIQVGWLSRLPVRVPCGRCNILILGEFLTSQEDLELSFTVQNAKELAPTDADYYAEASGEFITMKIRPHSADLEQMVTPYIRSFTSMGAENSMRFASAVRSFLKSIEDDWPRIRRVNELWADRRYDLLRNELDAAQVLEDSPFDQRTRLLRAINLMKLDFLTPLIGETNWRAIVEGTLVNLIDLSKRHPAMVAALVRYLGRTGRLVAWEHRIFRCLERVVLDFRFLIPAISLDYYVQPETQLVDEHGVTTAHIEDVKQLYVDLYEAAVEVVTVIVALNNIEHRGKFRRMQKRRKDVIHLEDFVTKSKGDRLAFITGNELFDSVLVSKPNGQLRNALGHGSYRFHGREQVLEYYPRGFESSDPKKEVSFLSFLVDCWSLALTTVVNLAEVVYQLRKAEFTLEHQM